MISRALLFVAAALLTACGGNTASTPTPTASPRLKASGDSAPTASPVVSASAPAASAAASAAVPSATGPLVGKTIGLPGAKENASLDYIAYEKANGRVWVPVGVTGSVDVLDIAKGTFTRVDGFKTEERERNGKKRIAGPSAASVGDGFVYIGNRATNEICPIDVKTLAVGKCLKLSSGTDGVSYVASAKEVWVTTPRDSAIAVLDAASPATLKTKATIRTAGEPEGYAVDDTHGVFFTNLEDKDATVAIDIKTHAVKSTWKPNCGGDGPRGLAYDAAHNFLIVACTDHLQVLDAGHDGALLGKLDTGAGIDNIDLMNGKIYAAAGKAAKLTIASLDDKGQWTVVATGETSQGARNAVADVNGNAFVADAPAARLWVFGPSAK